ncbi:serine/arginine repetitive matrix protein 3-like [Mastomys coucha]|uniref:serine/arginine repetitive matrix protein 3-like n=1 Tax=Mastomys coucha TaxID=35658 RepID=UPI0012616787|nr:serine/arginine repetitive matrix protein 3-like [Mastomys coucha]
MLEIANLRIQNKHQRAGTAKRTGRSGQAVPPRLSPEGGTAVLRGRARAARTDGPMDGGTVPAPLSPLPPGSAPASLCPSPGGGGGDRPGGPATPRDPARPRAASPGAPHRCSVAKHIALGTRRPSWLAPLGPMALARARFENGAERRSRPTRRERRRGCPGLQETLEVPPLSAPQPVSPRILALNLETTVRDWAGPSAEIHGTEWCSF